MFEHFKFTHSQIEKYYLSAKRDFRIAKEADVPEVSFRFCYDALLKLAIATCAYNGMRVKAKKGHHIELIKKLSFYLDDPDVDLLGNEMRSKRNWDLYGGGILISKKEAKEYLEWTENIFKNTQKYLDGKKRRLNF
ncbi:MAG: hypothetical protein V1804_00190 [Patescibacteria group bacterium]